MHLPPEMDGGPHQVIGAGEPWRPHWTITNDAATLWYHRHVPGKTGEHVYRDLAGLFIVDDDRADALDLPDDYGVDDIPLVVQDRRFDTNGQLIYDALHLGPPGLFDNPTGMLGDSILVNGTHAPYVEVPATLLRLRFLNGSNARRFTFVFSDGRLFYQIASDGGLLERPVERTRLLLAPGERAEILVDLAGASGPLTLLSDAVSDDVSVVTNLLQRMMAPGNDENQRFTILELRPRSSGFVRRAIPATLVTINRLEESDAVKTRTFTLEFTGTTINGKAMDHARVDEVVRKDDVEIWQVENKSIGYHPFHVHGVQCLVLDRKGRPTGHRAWKDTVIVEPEETVRLIMRFTTHADPSRPYMYHCHILEHEDMGMMGQFVVVDHYSDEVRLNTPLTGARATVGHQPHR